MVEKIPTYI